MHTPHVLISEEQIRRRCAALAAEISRDYVGKNLLLVCILKGSMHFFTDLARALTIPVEYSYLGVSSYHGDTESAGAVEFVVDLQESIEGRHVLLVEDIVDTGLTIQKVVERLANRDAASIKLVACLDKPSRRQVPVEIDYLGFTIEDHFVVGYGLDYGQRYRNLPHIAVLDDPPPLGLSKDTSADTSTDT